MRLNIEYFNNNYYVDILKKSTTQFWFLLYVLSLFFEYIFFSFYFLFPHVSKLQTNSKCDSKDGFGISGITLFSGI